MRVSPEPQPDELAAIISVVRDLLAEPAPEAEPAVSNWAFAARRENLRPRIWEPIGWARAARLKYP